MAVTRNMIRIFTFASTDPSCYYHEFWDQNDRALLHVAGGGGAYGGGVDWSHHMRTGGMGPGSGNHWSDQYRSVYGNFMLGNRSSFDRMYGTGAWDSYYTSAYTNQGSSGSGSIPGSTVITDRTNISTIIGWISSGFNVSIVSAFGNTNLIGSFGSLGSYSLGADGAIRFANPTAGMVAGEGVAAGGGGVINGFSENDFIKYSIKGTNIWASTILWGFAAARTTQPKVSTWIKGVKIFGRTTNYLGGVSIAYDFSTGNANTSTILDGAALIGGSIAIGAIGIVATPWVVAGGVVYGISSIFWEIPLNNALDISKTINFVKPKQ